MKNLNCIHLLGFTGVAPEIKTMEDGKIIAKFSIATTEKWESSTGIKHEKTTWHRCVAFDKLAKIFGDYVGKGCLIYVEGKQYHNSYKNEAGETCWSAEVKIENLIILSKKEEE